MSKHRDAYLEAVEKMFETTHIVQRNKIILRDATAVGLLSSRVDEGVSCSGLEKTNHDGIHSNERLPPAQTLRI